MARESFLSVARRRLLGLVYLAVVAGLIALSIAIYQKQFTPVTLVSVRFDHTGNNLQQDSDVSLRGLLVGTIRDINVDSGPNGGCATEQVACVTVTLALKPGMTHLIPNNVSAQILPKTIFGEQYVALVTPQHPGPAIQGGDRIQQDRTQGALETEKVLGDLLPLLQAVKPAELNATLTAMATALQGRGEKLGNTLVNLDQYLRQLNPHTRALADDIGKLGSVADEFNQIAPDIFATLRNLQTSVKTVRDEHQSLTDLLDTGSSTSKVIQSFLADNEQRLITLVGTTDKVYSLLDEYSPEFTCLFAGLNTLQKGANSVVHNSAFNLSAQLDLTNQGKYTQGQEPRYITGYGPHCFGLPGNPQPTRDGKFQIPKQFRCLNDGAPLTDDPCGRRPSHSRNSTSSYEQRAIATPGENALVSTLLSGDYHTSPDKVPPIATMLGAPLYRGMAVRVK